MGLMFNNFRKKFSRRNIVFGLCIAAFLLFVTDTLFFHFGDEPVVEYRDDVSLCERYFLEFPEGGQDVEINHKGAISMWRKSNGLFIDYGDTITVGDLEFRIKRVPVEFHDKVNPISNVTETGTE